LWQSGFFTRPSSASTNSVTRRAMLSSNTRSPLHLSICASAAEPSAKRTTRTAPACHRCIGHLLWLPAILASIEGKSAGRRNEQHEHFADLLERSEHVAALAADLVERKSARRKESQGQQCRCDQASGRSKREEERDKSQRRCCRNAVGGRQASSD